MAVALIADRLRSRLLNGPNGVAAPKLVPLFGGARARAQPRQRRRGNVDDDLAPSRWVGGALGSLEGAADD